MCAAHSLVIQERTETVPWRQARLEADPDASAPTTWQRIRRALAPHPSDPGTRRKSSRCSNSVSFQRYLRHAPRVSCAPALDPGCVKTTTDQESVESHACLPSNEPS